jgi:hypothetical protein
VQLRQNPQKLQQESENNLVAGPRPDRASSWLRLPRTESIILILQYYQIVRTIPVVSKNSIQQAKRIEFPDPVDENPCSVSQGISP